VVAQAIVALVLPPIGAVFFLLTLALLEEFERNGWPTLQGSPDGWPIPTGFGWCVAALAWWLCWATAIGTFELWRVWRSRRAARVPVATGRLR
jgi:hypothetical protein